MLEHSYPIQPQTRPELGRDAKAAFSEAGKNLRGRQLASNMKRIDGEHGELIVRIGPESALVQIRPVRGREIERQLGEVMEKRMSTAPAARFVPVEGSPEHHDFSGSPAIMLETVGLRDGSTIINVIPGFFKGQDVEFPVHNDARPDSILISQTSGVAVWKGHGMRAQTADHQVTLTLEESADGGVSVSAYSGVREAGRIWFAFIDDHGAVIQTARIDAAGASEGPAQGVIDVEYLGRSASDRSFKIPKESRIVFAFEQDTH